MCIHMHTPSHPLSSFLCFAHVRFVALHALNKPILSHSCVNFAVKVGQDECICPPLLISFFIIWGMSLLKLPHYSLISSIFHLILLLAFSFLGHHNISVHYLACLFVSTHCFLILPTPFHTSCCATLWAQSCWHYHVRGPIHLRLIIKHFV